MLNSMREIKFRAWDKKLKNMLFMDGMSMNWEYDHLTFRITGYTDEEEWSTNEEDLELMQYTGLKDKNGKEIYEGDLIKTHTEGDTLLVIWNERSGNGWALKRQDGTIIQGLFPTNDGAPYPEVEIVGNLYEHPELFPTKTPNELCG